MQGKHPAHRSFIALSLPGHVKQELGRQQKIFRTNFMRLGSFPKPAGFHLTLFFLGNCTDMQLDQVKKAINRAVLGKHCFNLETCALGTFPGKGRPPRVLWAGLTGDLILLEQLWKNLCSELKKENCLTQAPTFSPHITLARFKRKPPGEEFNDMMFKAGQLAKPSWFRIEKVELFTSRFTSKGPIHTLIHEARLSADFF